MYLRGILGHTETANDGVQRDRKLRVKGGVEAGIGIPERYPDRAHKMG